MNELSRDGAVSEQMETLIRVFSRHIVSFGGYYVQLNQDGKPIGGESFFSHTGFVLSLDGKWHIVTAGHVLADIERKLATGRVRITSQTLADYYGLGATNKYAYDFDFLGMPKVVMYEKGLDFAFIPISPHYRKLMEANRIVAFTEEDWNIPAGTEIGHYRLIGIPEHLIQLVDFKFEGQTHQVPGLRIVAAYLERKPDDTSLDYARLTGQIGSDLESVVGMSGGPVLAIPVSPDRHRPYFVVGIQSAWDQGTTPRRIYACPLSECLPIAIQLLNAAERKS